MAGVIKPTFLPVSSCLRAQAIQSEAHDRRAGPSTIDVFLPACGPLTMSGMIASAAADLAAGRLAILFDDTAMGGNGRGIFLHAAALVSTETVNTAILHGRGITCFSVTPEQAMRLGLTLAGQYRPDQRGPVFLRSVEAAECEGTGISAEDRALTLRAAGAPDATTASLKSPGHVVPAMITGARDTMHGELANAAWEVLRHLTAHDVPAWTDILDDDGELAGSAWCHALGARLGVYCLNLSEVLR